MASPTKIHLTPADTGVFKFKPQDEETAAIASQVLHKNHDVLSRSDVSSALLTCKSCQDFHIFYNRSGFHNHIVHHILSLYGLGAPGAIIEKQFERNASYQIPPKPVTVEIVHDMADPMKFKQFLGDAGHYHDFLVFFQQEMETKGVDGVLNEYVFAGT